RTDGENRRPRLLQCFRYARNAEDWSDAGDRIARGDHNGTRRFDGFDDAGSGFGVGDSGETYGVHRILIPALHKIFLEAELADGRANSGFYPRIAHGKNASLDTEFGSNLDRGL